ncbi:hypothetical protein BDN67DRAFT_986353, partial [Paxillus ammoniavirescens]
MAAMGDSFWCTTNTTWGNNVFAHEDWDGRDAWMYNRRPEGSVEDMYSLKRPVTSNCTTLEGVVGGGDAVIANAQDGSGFNNANFMTPADGVNGRCGMYLWNTASPYPDHDMESGIVIHELAHGLSTCLTGGPKNSGCLGWGESGGMGE